MVEVYRVRGARHIASVRAEGNGGGSTATGMDGWVVAMARGVRPGWIGANYRAHCMGHHPHRPHLRRQLRRYLWGDQVNLADHGDGDVHHKCDRQILGGYSRSNFFKSCRTPSR